MKKILALLLAIAMIAAFAACGAKDEAAPTVDEASAPADEAPAAEAPADAEVTWADYQAYLIEKAGANAPDLDEFTAQVEAIGSWEDIDQTVSPWDQMFTTIGLSTWEEFQAGTVKEPAVMGGPDASASGESSAEPAEGDASGEPSGEPPVSAAAENTAHGGTAGAVSDADYQAYLKAWLAAEAEVNTTMTQEQIDGEFIPLIEAGNYTDFPVEMMFSGMLSTGAAMTYDEFVAADGVY